MEEKKRNFCPYIGTKLQFYMVYMEENFFPRLFALYWQNSKEFLSPLVFHTVLWTNVFHPILLFFFFFVVVFFFLIIIIIIEQGFACNSMELLG